MNSMEITNVALTTPGVECSTNMERKPAARSALQTGLRYALFITATLLLVLVAFTVISSVCEIESQLTKIQASLVSIHH
jgi:hypothetical protein